MSRRGSRPRSTGRSRRIRRAAFPPWPRSPRSCVPASREVEGDGAAREDDLAMTLVTPPAHAAPRPARVLAGARRPFGWVLLALVVAGAVVAAVFLVGGRATSRRATAAAARRRDRPTARRRRLRPLGESDSTPTRRRRNGRRFQHRLDDADLRHDRVRRAQGRASGSCWTPALGEADAANGDDAGTPGFTAHIGVADSQSGPFTADSSSQTVVRHDDIHARREERAVLRRLDHAARVDRVTRRSPRSRPRASTSSFERRSCRSSASSISLSSASA